MQDLKHVFSYLKPYRRDLFLAVGLVFVECIFEMVIPMLMSDLVDQGVPSHDMQVIMLQGSKMIICAVLALITGLLYARFAARAANGFAAALREAEYRKLQQFDFANLDHFSTPSLVTRMTTDVTVMLNAVATGLRPLVRSPVMLFMGLGMAFLLNAKLTIVFLITTPILAVILAWIVTKVGPLYDRQQTAVDHLNGRVQEALTAIRAIKAFVRGDYENEQFETVNDELAAASTNTFRYAVLNLPAFQAVMYTAIVCIMWYGGNFILTDRMTVGELTAFLSYVLQVLNSVMMFSGVFLQLTRSLTSARRIRAVLEEQPALATPADPVAAVADGSIDFADVSFKYSAAAAGAFGISYLGQRDHAPADPRLGGAALLRAFCGRTAGPRRPCRLRPGQAAQAVAGAGVLQPGGQHAKGGADRLPTVRRPASRRLCRPARSARHWGLHGWGYCLHCIWHPSPGGGRQRAAGICPAG